MTSNKKIRKLLSEKGLSVLTQAAIFKLLANLFHIPSRKIAMFNKADGFLVLPGGVGTLEEFFEVLSWKQLQIHRKPIILFNLNNYWSQLIELIDKTIDCKFTGENIKDAYIVVDNTAELRKVLNINVKN